MGLYAIPIRFGVATSGCLIIYFLMLSLFELHTNVLFSLFNVVITAVGIYLAIKMFRDRSEQNFNYGEGFVAGMVAGGAATLIFMMFFTLYAMELDTDFLANLSTTWFQQYHFFEAIVFLTVAIMGFATSLVLTLFFMQLFKTSNNLAKKTA